MTESSKLPAFLDTFADWFIFQSLLVEYANYLQESVADDLNLMDKAMDKRSVILAFVNGKLAESRAWNQQALGIATEEAVREGLSGNALGFVAKGRIHSVTKALEILDRMSATVTHQLEVLRTRTSRAKQELPQRSYGRN